MQIPEGPAAPLATVEFPYGDRQALKERALHFRELLAQLVLHLPVLLAQLMAALHSSTVRPCCVLQKDIKA